MAELVQEHVVQRAEHYVDLGYALEPRPFERVLPDIVQILVADRHGSILEPRIDLAVATFDLHRQRARQPERAEQMLQPLECAVILQPFVDRLVQRILRQHVDNLDRVGLRCVRNRGRRHRAGHAAQGNECDSHRLLLPARARPSSPLLYTKQVSCADKSPSIEAGSRPTPSPCSPPSRGRNRPAACSMTWPSANSLSSSNGRPMSCRPSGSPSRRRAGRHGDARQAGHVHRHREHVVEIHLDRVGAALLADAECRRRRCRREDRIHARGEHVLEIPLDQRAHLCARR